MSLEESLSCLYFEKFKKSTALNLRKKYRNTPERFLQDCQELKIIYSQMKNTHNRANFLENKTVLDKLPAPKKHNEKSCIGIIVETRKNIHMERVIKNFIQQTGLDVQIFHGRNNLQYILESALNNEIISGKITLSELYTDKLDAPAYNALFLSTRFWESMNGRAKIFVFQTDSWICEESIFCLNDFLKFDYIGSKWPRKRPSGLIIDGGNGGLSIRDWKKSFECLKHFSPLPWTGGEDGFFAFHLELIGGFVAKTADCEKFSTQYSFKQKSFGAHQISCLPIDQQEKFLLYCPNTAFLAHY